MNNQEALLLPKSHKFQKEGFCGSSGYVEVIIYSFRLSMKIIHLFSVIKFTTENASVPNFLKKINFGI